MCYFMNLLLLLGSKVIFKNKIAQAFIASQQI